MASSLFYGVFFRDVHKTIISVEHSGAARGQFAMK